MYKEAIKILSLSEISPDLPVERWIRADDRGLDCQAKECLQLCENVSARVKRNSLSPFALCLSI